jgi:hypothetical protein
MDVRAIVSLPFISGKPEDVTVNVLHFSSASWDSTAQGVIRDHIVEMFNVAPPNGPSGNALMPVAALLSNALSRTANAATIKLYNLADPKPRVPVTFTWTLGVSLFTTDTELPAEVALCCSIYAVQNTARKRGRIYFGPFVKTASDDDATTQRAKPSVTVRETIGGAVKRLILKPANTQNLAVYTRGLYTVGGVAQPPVPGVGQVVTNGWVDDAWDTQRRRGQRATLRYAF